MAAELGNYVHELRAALINFESTQRENGYRKSLHQLTTFVRPILAQAQLLAEVCLQLLKVILLLVLVLVQFPSRMLVELIYSAYSMKGR